MPQVPYVSRNFVVYLASFVSVAPFFRSLDLHVASRNKFFAKALGTLADFNNKALSMYLNCKATACYLLFPPVHSPYCMDDTQEVIGKDHEGPTW